MDYWKRGERRRLAREAGIHETDLYHIITRYIRTNPHRAAALAAHSSIAFEHWLWNKETTHPAFKGDPVLELPEGIKLKVYKKKG